MQVLQVRRGLQVHPDHPVLLVALVQQGHPAQQDLLGLLDQQVLLVALDQQERQQGLEHPQQALVLLVCLQVVQTPLKYSLSRYPQGM